MPPEIIARPRKELMSRATDCIHARQYGPDLWCAKEHCQVTCLIDNCKPCDQEELPRKNDGSQMAQTNNIRMDEIALLKEASSYLNWPYSMEHRLAAKSRIDAVIAQHTKRCTQIWT